MTPDPAEAAVIVDATDKAIRGASLAELARLWNSARVAQPQTGRSRWTPNCVRQILTSPRNAGLIAHKKEALGPAQWPAIVPRPLWEECQAVLAGRATHHGPRRRSLLTGLLICGRCGAKMVRATYSRDRRIRVWRCSPLPGTDGCGRVQIGAEPLERHITEATLLRIDTPEMAVLLDERSGTGQHSAELTRELDALERRLDAASDAYAEGKLPLRAFERSTAVIQTQQKRLQTRLGQLVQVSAAGAYAGRAGALSAAWPGLTVDQRRAVIAAVLGRMKVMPAPVRGRPSFDSERVEIAPLTLAASPA
jgi:hypothetical protein